MRCDGFSRMRVSELFVPPRCPEVSAMGTLMVRSFAWYMYTVPSGMRWETMARATTTPLRLYDSIHSLSRTPIFSASFGDIQMVGPPRERVSIMRLSWYSEWIDHFECGVR